MMIQAKQFTPFQVLKRVAHVLSESFQPVCYSCAITDSFRPYPTGQTRWSLVVSSFYPRVSGKNPYLLCVP